MGENPRSNLTCSSPKFTITPGNFHRTGIGLFYIYCIYLYISSVDSNQVCKIESETPPLVFQQGSRAEIRRSDIEMASTKFKWTDPNGEASSWDRLFSNQICVCVGEEQWVFIRLITHFYWDFIGIQCSLLSRLATVQKTCDPGVNRRGVQGSRASPLTRSQCSSYGRRRGRPAWRWSLPASDPPNRWSTLRCLY